MPVTSIDDFAFAGHELSSVVIPDDVKSIGVGAFMANKLDSITIPASVTFIDNGSFGLNPLTSVTVDDNNTVYWDENNTGIYKNEPNVGKVIIQGTQSGEIAAGTKVVGDMAFLSVGLDGEVNIPDSVEIIRNLAFSSSLEGIQGVETNKITKVVVPSSVKEINYYAFLDVQLETAILHEGLQKIGEGAFGGNDLSVVEIPKTVQSIGDHAFAWNNLSEVIIWAEEPRFESRFVFSWNQDNSADLTIYGYKGSDVEIFAADQGYTFIPFPHQLPLNHAEPYDFYSEEVIEIINGDGEIVGTIQMPEFDELSPLAPARLLIRDVAKEDVTATGLEVAGQIVDILFVSWEYDYDPDNPNEDEILNDEINELDEEFGLSLRINNDATGDIGMYHEIGHDDWDHVDGDISNGFVTATVTDFSKYGVFAMVEEEPTLIEITVEKVWEGEAQDSVTVHLLANGEITDSIELSESNNWQHTFLELPLEDFEGNPIEYTVEEETVEGYETSITGSAKDGFIITNTEIVEED